MLETLDVRARLDALNRILIKELEVLELGSKIQSQVQSEVGRNQREYFLREQLKAIQKELGETDDQTKEIDELAEKSSFLEVAWLLINGELPTAKQLEEFKELITVHTMVHQDFNRFFEGFPKDAHPMPVCAAAVGALATFYQQPETEQNVREAVVRLIAKMPTIASYSYKHSIGQPFMYPQNKLDYSANFLHMMFATPCEDMVVNPVMTLSFWSKFM